MHALLFIRLYGKANIKYAVAARADEKPLGFAAVLFKDAVKAVFIAAIRANLELVFELDLFHFSIHDITCFTPRRKEVKETLRTPSLLTADYADWRRLFVRSTPVK